MRGKRLSKEEEECILLLRLGPVESRSPDRFFLSYSEIARVVKAGTETVRKTCLNYWNPPAPRRKPLP